MLVPIGSVVRYSCDCHLQNYVGLLIFNYYTLVFLQDGGCTCPGDVAKAIGAGADFVMLGGMLAGHDQSGGEVIEKNGVKRKLFYGMSSSTAMKKHKGGVAEYRYYYSGFE